MALLIYCPEWWSSLHDFNSSGEVLDCTGNVSWNVRWNHLRRKREFVFHNLYIYLPRFSVLGRQIRFAIRSQTNEPSVRTIGQIRNLVWLKRIQSHGCRGSELQGTGGTTRLWPPRTRNEANNVTILVMDKTYIVVVSYELLAELV